MRTFPNFRTTTFEGSADAVPASLADTPVRMAFLRKVYSLFSMAILIFVGTMAWGATQPADSWVNQLFGRMTFMGFILFMAAIFFLARVTAKRFPLNLIGLGLFAVLEGLMVSPMVGQVVATSGPGVVFQAFGLTAVVFGGLTAYVLLTKKDFSWMRAALWTGFWLMIGIAVLSFFGIGAGFVMGWGYSAAMVLLFAGFMIYDTSMILHRYPANMAASAALTIFLDFVIMFIHILRLFSRRD